MKRQPLGELLVAAKILTPGQLRTALAYQENNGGRLGEIIVMLGLVSESQLMFTLSKQLGIPYRKVGNLRIQPEVLRRVPRSLMERHCVLPVAILPGQPRSRLLVAMADPQNVKLIDEIAFAAGTPVSPLLTSRADIESAFRSNGIQGCRQPSWQMELEDDPSEEFVIVRDGSVLAP